MSKHWTFKGIRQLEKQLNRKTKDIDYASSEGLVNAAKYLLELSQPLVPVDTGRLKASGNVYKQNKNTVYVSYQAFNPVNDYDYAPIQHENLMFNHNIGQAKYLEQPFRENMDEIVNRIAEKIQEGVDK